MQLGDWHMRDIRIDLGTNGSLQVGRKAAAQDPQGAWRCGDHKGADRAGVQSFIQSVGRLSKEVFFCPLVKVGLLNGTARTTRHRVQPPWPVGSKVAAWVILPLKRELDAEHGLETGALVSNDQDPAAVAGREDFVVVYVDA